MPQKIICGGCGKVFYEGTDLKLPEEFVQQLNGVCPECGKSLTCDPKNIDIQALKLNGKSR